MKQTKQMHNWMRKNPSHEAAVWCETVQSSWAAKYRLQHVNALLKRNWNMAIRQNQNISATCCLFQTNLTVAVVRKMVIESNVQFKYWGSNLMLTFWEITKETVFLTFFLKHFVTFFMWQCWRAHPELHLKTVYTINIKVCLLLSSDALVLTGASAPLPEPQSLG